jgi:hypothetical protein
MSSPVEVNISFHTQRQKNQVSVMILAVSVGAIVDEDREETSEDDATRER